MIVFRHIQFLSTTYITWLFSLYARIGPGPRSMVRSQKSLKKPISGIHRHHHNWTATIVCQKSTNQDKRELALYDEQRYNTGMNRKRTPHNGWKEGRIGERRRRVPFSVISAFQVPPDTEQQESFVEPHHHVQTTETTQASHVPLTFS